MAKELESIERSVLTPTQTITTTNAFSRLGDASSGLARIISDKAGEIGEDLAGRQGQEDATSGKAPKTLAPPINKATRAYNNAVRDTEARQQVMAAREQIRDAYADATSPANFTSESPALFNATMQGIVEGTLANTRESNRPAVKLALDQLTSDAKANIHAHAVKYDNEQTVNNMTSEMDLMLSNRRNAAINGRVGDVTAYDEMIDKALTDYGEQSAVIQAKLPQLRKSLEQSREIDTVLSGYAQATTEGTQSEYLSNLAANKDDLSFDTWQKATKEVLHLQATEEKLNLESRTQSNQLAINGIDNNTITSDQEIMQMPNLTLTDQYKLMNHLQQHQQKQLKQQASTITALNNIAQGNPGFNSSDQKNNLFNDARTRYEKETGQPMSLMDMYQSVLGKSAYPATGIVGVSVGSNVPMFDAQLKTQLTSRDPAQIAQAAAVVNDVLKIQKNPNLIKLSGDALDIATSYNNANLGGVDQLTLAQQVSDTVQNASEPDQQVRSKAYTSNYGSKPKVMQGLFKRTFDTNYVQGVSDSAYGVFQEVFRRHFLKSNNEQDALDSTRYEMRAWGPSDYFEPGTVAQPVPEKELSITSVGHAFDNQLRIATQLLINKNKEALQANNALPQNKRNPKPFSIEWVSDKQEINVEALSDNDRVFKNLGQSDDLMSDATLAETIFPKAKPQVKINGRKTEIFLMPTPESRLGERVQYGLFYLDKFGMAQPVPNPESPSGSAMFSPVGLDAWAPSVLNEKNDEMLKESALKFKKAQAMAEWKMLQPQNIWQELAQYTSMGMFMRGTPAQRREILERLHDKDTGGLESILKQRIQGQKAQPGKQASEASDADHVGIKADQSGGNE